MEPTDESYAWSQRGDVRVASWPDLDALGVHAVVTGRHGGVSVGPYASLNLGLHVGDDPEAVVENRHRAAATVGLELDDLVFCRQEHGRGVATITAADRGRGTRSLDDAIGGADALVTDQVGIGLVVMVADCVPMVLFDPERRVLATVHSGWRGTVARVAAATVATMAGMGCEPARLVAAIGPAIPAGRYEVGDDVAVHTRRTFGSSAGEVIAPRPGGRWSFDLWQANRIVLAEAGVRPERILAAELPTGVDTPFFSDRARRPCGRFAVLARM